MAPSPTILSRIIKDPNPQDFGKLKIEAIILKQDQDSNNNRFHSSCLAQEFMRNEEDCENIKNLKRFLRESRSDNNNLDVIETINNIVSNVKDLSHDTNNYSPNCLLYCLIFIEDMPDDYHDDDDDEDDDDDDDDDDDVYYNGVMPADELVIENLDKRIYKKKKKNKIKCTICLENMKNGAVVVTLPCGHEFDENCIVEWLGINHYCPLCRFKLA